MKRARGGGCSSKIGAQFVRKKYLLFLVGCGQQPQNFIHKQDAVTSGGLLFLFR